MNRRIEKLKTFDYRLGGFTIVELIIIVAIIAILAALSLVAYNGTQRRSSSAVIQQSISDVRKTLQVYYSFNHNYPPNIANTGYAPPLSVAIVLYTNAPQVPVYANLNDEQNAQLFLNACNGFMPVTDESTTYNNSCVYNGNNAHIKGTVSSNVVIHGPTIQQADFQLTCGPACDVAQNEILASFFAQGGTFPIIVPKKGSVLPAPTMQVTGPASEYCIEGRSAQFNDLVFHATPEAAVSNGPCPSNPNLHYP